MLKLKLQVLIYSNLQCNLDDIDDPCDPNPCNNGGTCMNNNGQAMCDCPPGRTGSTCGKYWILIK